MKDTDKTKERLIGELTTLRRRVVELETAEQAPQKLARVLRECIKELQGIYDIAQIVDRPGIMLDEIYQEVVARLPGGWQYPETTCARITIGGREFKTENFRKTEWQQSAEIEVNGARVGVIEVDYLEERPESDEGPFLEEERILINVIAGRLGRITERRQMEKELRESKEKYETLIKNIPVTIYSALPDETATMVFISDRWRDWTGYSPQDFYRDRRAWPKSVHPEDLARATRAYVDAYQKKKEYVFEYRIVHKDTGQVYYVRDHGIPIKDEKGNVIGFDGIITNITEHKQLEAEKTELEERAQITSRLASLGQLATGLAHEINNPLTAVVNCSYVLTQKDLPEDVGKNLKTIYHGAQRAADIVGRLLAFARQQEPERTYTDVNKLVEAAIALRAYEMEAANIKVVTRLAPDLPRTMADAGQLQQVFLNIILNAEVEMRLAHGGGRLMVKTERADDGIRISFKDDGPGIAREYLARIFDPFFTTREVGQGTGLGLTLCHRIVTEHGGRIYARSRPGKGATIIVELPIVVEEKQPWRAGPSARGEQAARREPRYR
ncbi:MAG: PAS domain-containing protein [Chloroflexi bacterium]|nr:PAS domain-containing protein [Chloroflexota bacterium]